MSSPQPLNADQLKAAIADADIRVLLMVLVHMTGDMRWLEPPYQPKRDVRLIPDPQAGLPPEVQDEIRAAAIRVLGEPDAKPVIGDPGDALMLRMMSVTLGEEVAPEYAPMIREEMALVDRAVHWGADAPPGAARERHVLIVGAGVCAIALGVSLARLGIPYTIVEKSGDIGGTWHDNRYPGCGVDTPNHSYSFSFAPNRWTRYFSQRAELHDYLKRVADEFGVTPHVRLNAELTSAQWDETRLVWRVTLRTDKGVEQMETPVLVTAIGQLNDPSLAPFAGAEAFRGTLVHPARWPADLDLSGKRVAVIGTGATAMQLVPTIADQVKSLTIYQRSAQWARPVLGYGGEISDNAQWLMENVPLYKEWFRFNMFWRYGDGLLPLLRKDPEWPHPQRAVNRANDRHRKEMTDFIVAELGDRTDLIEKCVPIYPPYGKRILLDNGWFKTLTKPHVELVTEPIARFDETGIVTGDGQHRDADVIVVSTGFRVSEMAARLNITGVGGETLAQAWRDDNPTAHLGITVPGFPNLFMMLGPNSGPAHGGSVIFQAECQARYITDCLVAMAEQDIAALDVKRDAHDAYVDKVDAEHAQLIWTHPGMTTYYRNARGRVFSAMPWRFVDYWRMTHDVDLGEYRQIKAGAAAPPRRMASQAAQ